MTRVCVLGSTGFLGKNLLKDTDWIGVSRQDLDLENQKDVEKFFTKNTFDVVIHSAAVFGCDSKDILLKNIIMFENVARIFKGKLIYFSSGAALRGDPPSDPYGLSKWIIDKRIQTIPDAYSLRIWGCYGDHELPTRFSAVCKIYGHVTIKKDKYFDFVSVDRVKEITEEYVNSIRNDKECNIVERPKGRPMLLSEWAEKFGATFCVEDPSELGDSYISSNLISS